MDQNFTYLTSRKTLDFYSPSQTNGAKSGMCADFAAFSAFFLHNDGYTANILHYTYGDPQTDSHYVTLYEDQGADYIVSNGSKVGPVGSDNLYTTLASLTRKHDGSLVSPSDINSLVYLPWNGGNSNFAQQS